MHVPDGFLNVPTSIATGVVAAAGIAAALPLARKEAADDRKAPMVGIVATLIFAVQMINFPVGAGTSGHLMGGALAAVLVGLSATLARLPATQIIVTHDLPYALELCPRALILDGGRIVADGATGDLLADGALMTAHGLELPWGFDPTRGRS